MVGVDISNGRARCRGCKQKIAKGEKRFWYLGGEYYCNPNIYYWHPKCFLKYQLGTYSGEEAIKSIIEVFLPLIVGEEVSAPIILAMKLGR
ncbi:MAG: hypothetical protein ACP5KV_04165 [Candidatus Methanomethylicaceae archaeon]